jgi:hypothetical protein
VARSLLVGEQAGGAGAGPARVVDRLVHVPRLRRLEEVVGQLAQVLVGVVAVQLLEHLGGEPVQRQAPACGEPAVEGLADDRVREPVAADLAGRYLHDPRADRLLEELDRGLPRHARDSGEGLEPELASDDGGDRQEAARLLGKLRDAPVDDLAHPLGDPELLDPPRVTHPATGALVEGAALHEVAQHLLHEVRVPLGLAVDRLHQRQLVRARELLLGDLLEHRPHLLDAEPAQQDALVGVLAAQRGEHLGQRVVAVEVGVAVRAEQQDSAVADLARHELEQEQRGLVGRVQVVEHDRERLAPRGVPQEARDRVEQAEARLLRLERLRLGKAGQPLAHLGHDLGDVGGARAHVRDELVLVPLVHVGPDHLDPWPVDGCALALVAAAPQHLCTAQAGVGGDLGGHACLADPGLAREHHEAAAAGHGLVEPRAQFARLVAAADEDAAAEPVEARLLRGGLAVAGLDERRDRGELVSHGGGALRAVGGRLRQQAQHEVLERPRHVRGVPGWADRGRVDVLGDDRDGVVPDEGRPARQQLVEHCAERVEVRAGVRGAPHPLLRRHVRHRAEHRPLAGEWPAVGRDRQPEVAELRGAVRAQPDVLRLDVAVHDAARMRMGEGLCDLLGGPDGVEHRQPVALGLLEARGELAAGHELADDVEPPVLLADVVDHHDVRVVAEPPHRLALAARPGQADLVESLRLDQCHGHLAVETGVAGEVDALAPALPNEPQQFVAAAGDRPVGRGRLPRHAGRERVAAAVAVLRPGGDLDAALGTPGGRGQRCRALGAEPRALPVRVAARRTVHPMSGIAAFDPEKCTRPRPECGKRPAVRRLR